jgi:Ser/Thr protein kinase RdoA (MazF antagonist)
MSSAVAARDQFEAGPLGCPAVAEELPTLAAAVDTRAMVARLAELLLPRGGDVSIRTLEVAQAMYQPGRECIVRYLVDVVSDGDDTPVTLLIGARIFPNNASCEQWYRDALEPLGARLEQRPEIRPLSRPVAVIPDLQMAVSVFPADGSIPALVDATDITVMAPLIERALANGGTPVRRVVDLRIDRGHYGRRNRCVLRYAADVDGGAHGRIPMVFYGKVGADDRAKRLAVGVAAMRAAQAQGAFKALAAIPDIFLVDAKLGLALLTEVAGRPTVGSLVKRAASGGGDPVGLDLDHAIEISARVAASLHSCGIGLGPKRTIDADLDQLGVEVHAIRSVAPALGLALLRQLDTVTRRAQATQALPLRFGHGDFTYTQLLFDGADCSLVDFDTLCQAETARDIGHYLAHLRVAALRACRRVRHPSEAVNADRLRQRFIDAYLDAAPDGPVAQLRERVELYEMVSLIRLAVHSWQKFKADRLREVIAILEEEPHQSGAVLHGPSEASMTSQAVKAGLGPLEQAIEALTRPPSWLVTIGSDGETVAETLRRIVPEFASGALRLTRCEVKRPRLHADGFRGRYRLSVVAQGGAERTVELRVEWMAPSQLPQRDSDPDAAFGEPGWRLIAPDLGVVLTPEPPGDESLPLVHSLTDPALAADVLQRALGGDSSGYPGFAVHGCDLEVMRYKPGSRCTVRYQLTLPPEQEERGWPRAVIGKIWHGEKGPNAHRGMVDLWNSPLRTSPHVRIAEPMAFLEKENVLVQSVIPGEMTLKAILRQPESWQGTGLTRLHGLIAKTGLGLADLHSCGVEAVGSFNWADELGELESRIERMDAVVPGFADTVSPVVAAVAALGAAHPPESEVPSHISFRPAQVLVDANGNLGFIDFDGFCRAEPAVDLALFCMTVRDCALRGIGDAEGGLPGSHLHGPLDALCEVFVAAYESARPISRPRLAAWASLLRLNSVVGLWTKGKLGVLDVRTELLRRQLSAVGLLP